MPQRPVTLLFLAASALVCSAASAQDRAQEVLTQARQAMGMKAPVSSLTVNATVRRVQSTMGFEVSSDVQIEIQTPDKLRRTESISMAGLSRDITMGLNGEEPFYDDGGAAAAMGMDPFAPGPRRVEAIRNMKEEIVRSFAVWTLAIPEGPAYTLTHAGTAEAPDGKADVLELKGPDDVNLRLFFDSHTHRLLMATHQVQTVDLDKQKLQALQEEMRQKIAANPQDAQKFAKEMMDAAQAMPKKTVTKEVRFSDYRGVNGVSFPHQMSVSGGQNQAQEDWAISSFKLNAPIKPERFAAKKK